MKKAITKLALTTTLLITLVAPVTTQAKSKHTRTVKAIVTEVNNDEIIIETKDGNQWAFYGDGYEAEQTVKVYFDTMGTKTIYDDEIIRVKNIK